MDVFIFQGGAEPLAEAGPGFLPPRSYYKTPFLPQDSCVVERRIITLSDVMRLKNVEHVVVISQN